MNEFLVCANIFFLNRPNEEYYNIERIHNYMIHIHVSAILLEELRICWW